MTTTNKSLRFPVTIGVLATSDAQGWPLADALAAEIPSGSPHKVYEQMRAAAQAKGLRVPSVSKLRQDRATGEYWQNKADRVTDAVGRTVGYSAHKEAQRKGTVDQAKALLDELVVAVGGDAHKVTVPMVKQALGDTLPAKAATATVAGTATGTGTVVVDTRTRLEVLTDAVGEWIDETLRKGAKTLTDTDLRMVEALIANLGSVIGPEQARRQAKANRPAPVQVQAKAKPKPVVRPSAPVVVAGTEAQIEAAVTEQARVKASVEPAPKPAPRKRMRG
jgi:hypothetical protein